MEGTIFHTPENVYILFRALRACINSVTINYNLNLRINIRINMIKTNNKYSKNKTNSTRVVWSWGQKIVRSNIMATAVACRPYFRSYLFIYLFAWRFSGKTTKITSTTLRRLSNPYLHEVFSLFSDNNIGKVFGTKKRTDFVVWPNCFVVKVNRNSNDFIHSFEHPCHPENG